MNFIHRWWYEAPAYAKTAWIFATILFCAYNTTGLGFWVGIGVGIPAGIVFYLYFKRIERGGKKRKLTTEMKITTVLAIVLILFIVFLSAGFYPQALLEPPYKSPNLYPCVEENEAKGISLELSDIDMEKAESSSESCYYLKNNDYHFIFFTPSGISYYDNDKLREGEYILGQNIIVWHPYKDWLPYKKEYSERVDEDPSKNAVSRYYEIWNDTTSKDYVAIVSEDDVGFKSIIIKNKIYGNYGIVTYKQNVLVHLTIWHNGLGEKAITDKLIKYSNLIFSKIPQE